MRNVLHGLLGFLGLLAMVAAPGVASAQTVYNPDGSRSLLGPDPAGLDGRAPTSPVFDDGRASGTGAVAASAGPLGDPGAPGQMGERFDLDCDPDIDVCVDPNAPPMFDDGYDPNAYQQFEGALSPYGSWSEDPSYGRVWTPSPQYVGNDFMPYSTGGEWVATNDYGMAWASDYDWGWAPFHYGRWLFLAGCGGWSWIPGSVWGPAWVDWRYGGGYVGWAPLPPHGVIVGAPVQSLGTRTPWRFTVAGELFHRNPQYVPGHVVASVFTRTQPVHNLRTMTLGGVTTHITLGPSLATVSHDLGRTVPALSLKSSAPNVLPRKQIVARQGVSLGERSYVHSNSQTHVPGAMQPGVPAPGGAAATYHYNNNSQVPTYHYNNTAPSAYRPAPPSYPPPTHYNNGNVPPAYRSPPPAYNPPAYHPPAYNPPAYSAPAYHAPSQPAYSAPAYRAPAYSPPAYRAPAPTYSAPAYHAPAVAAPSYHAPTYSAPPHVSAPAPSSSQRRH